MAATGLLGINPYGKGVVLDISSKPVAFAMQQQQKEQAKRDALEKYFMDYEKSINPAGVRKVEGDEFMKRMADYKSYFIQNRDKILNPSKYGYDAQSEASAKLKDMVNLIDQSKRAAAEDKAFKSYMDNIHRSGKKYDINQVNDVLSRSRQLATSEGYQAPDASLINIYDPYNEGKVMEEINRLKRTEGKARLEPLGGGYQQWVTPKNVDEMALRAYSQGKLQDQGWVEYLKDMASHPGEYNQLNELYKKIPGFANKNLSKDDLATISYLHSKRLAPTIEDRTNPVLTREAGVEDALRKQKAAVPEYDPDIHFDALNKAADDLPINEKIDFITKDGKKIEGKKLPIPDDILDKYKRKVGRFEQKPDYMYQSGSSVYPVFESGKTKYGSPEIEVGQPISIEGDLKPQMGKFYGGVGWTRKNIYTDKPSENIIKLSGQINPSTLKKGQKYEVKGKTYTWDGKSLK